MPQFPLFREVHLVKMAYLVVRFGSGDFQGLSLHSLFFRGIMCQAVAQRINLRLGSVHREPIGMKLLSNMLSKLESVRSKV